MSDLFDTISRLLNVTTAVGVAVTGAFGWVALEFNKRRKAEIEVRVIQSLFSIATGVSEDKLTLKVISQKLSQNISSLEGMEHLIHAIPQPYLFWAKERVGERDYVMFVVNGYFAKVFLGKSLGYYSGKRDSEIWPRELADMFADSDEAAYEMQSPHHVEEPVSSDLTSAYGTFIGWKFTLDFDDKVFVCGIGEFKPAKEGEVVA